LIDAGSVNALHLESDVPFLMTESSFEQLLLGLKYGRLCVGQKLREGQHTPSKTDSNQYVFENGLSGHSKL
jgi:hypothetical protein